MDSMLACFSVPTRDYSLNTFGDQVYPTRRNGSEYYLYDADGNPVFAKDRLGVTRYARDVSGNELYPKSKSGPSFLFHHRLQYPVYAQDSSGNERYPKWKGREMMIVLGDGEMLVARYASGRQRYPLDRRGNEYFPLCKITRKPHYLLDERGVAYRPVTVNGYEMYLKSDEVPEEAGYIYEKKDALGSTVYTEDHKMKRDSVWTHVKEACVVGCIGLYTAFYCWSIL